MIGIDNLFILTLALLTLSLFVIRQRRDDPDYQPSAVVTGLLVLVCAAGGILTLGGLIFAAIADVAAHRPNNELAGIGIVIGLMAAVGGAIILTLGATILRVRRRR